MDMLAKNPELYSCPRCNKPYSNLPPDCWGQHFGSFKGVCNECYNWLTINFDKQQILFVVGPDMSGKTNIAKAIVAETGFAYFKASSEHGTYLKSKNRFIDQLRHADPRVADFMKQTGVNVIMDRGFPCEYAYSKVLGRRTDKKMIKMMDEAYASLGSKILFCHRSSYEGIIDDIDSKLDAQKLQLIHEAYEEFFKMSKCSVHHLNVDDEDLKREVDEAIGFMIS